MTNRYWEPVPPPEALLNWVDENVKQAIDDMWTGKMPIVWIGGDEEDTVHILTVAGPEKINDETDCYSWDFNVLDEVKCYLRPYAEIGGPCSEEQREDMKERISRIREFAEKISDMADEYGSGK